MIFRNFINLLKTQKFQTFSFIIINTFLIFFLNILLVLSYYFYNFSNEVKNKLWIYIYIKNDNDRNLAKALNLVSKLKDQGLKVEFYSKEDALNLFKKNIPDIVTSLKKFWIENPLPDTLYVIVRDYEEYEKFKKILDEYKDIVFNIDDLTQKPLFLTQQERIKYIIEMFNFLIYFDIFIILNLIFIIIFLMITFIRLNFYSFINQIKIEKLLGAFYYQIKLPFILKITFIYFIWVILNFFISYFFILYLDKYIISLFNFSIFDILFINLSYILKIYFIEIFLLYSLIIVFSNFSLNRLLSKL